MNAPLPQSYTMRQKAVFPYTEFWKIFQYKLSVLAVMLMVIHGMLFSPKQFFSVNG